jgi:hypothetical protein
MRLRMDLDPSKEEALLLAVHVVVELGCSKVAVAAGSCCIDRTPC